jgi:hypothetical protein
MPPPRGAFRNCVKYVLANFLQPQQHWQVHEDVCAVHTAAVAELIAAAAASAADAAAVCQTWDWLLCFKADSKLSFSLARWLRSLT